MLLLLLGTPKIVFTQSLPLSISPAGSQLPDASYGGSYSRIDQLTLFNRYSIDSHFEWLQNRDRLGRFTTSSLRLCRRSWDFTGQGGVAVQPTSLTIDVSSVFDNFYRGSASTQFGSQFRLTVPFTVQGNSNSIVSVSATLSNSQGTSAAASQNF
jgi:hypothetical protein